jgi:hypothetical protein
MWQNRIERTTFPSDNEWGIPWLPFIPSSTPMPSEIIVYPQKTRKDTSSLGLHFFTHDFRFNTVWNQAKKGLKVVEKYLCTFTPDFSLFGSTPRAEQLMNTYRNRWCGAYWASHGVTVIPTIGWSDEKSFDYAFLGVPRNSVVAISTVGIHRSREGRSTFESGFNAMLEALEPNRILCYGKALEHMEQHNNISYYPDYWELKNGKSDQNLPFETRDTIDF